jgi:hypothetical protein
MTQESLLSKTECLVVNVNKLALFVVLRIVDTIGLDIAYIAFVQIDAITVLD